MPPTAEELAKQTTEAKATDEAKVKKGKRKEGLAVLAQFNVRMPPAWQKPFSQHCKDTGISANIRTLMLLEPYLKGAGVIPKDMVTEFKGLGGVGKLHEELEAKDMKIAELEKKYTELLKSKK